MFSIEYVPYDTASTKFYEDAGNQLSSCGTSLKGRGLYNRVVMEYQPSSYQLKEVGKHTPQGMPKLKDYADDLLGHVKEKAESLT